MIRLTSKCMQIAIVKKNTSGYFLLLDEMVGCRGSEPVAEWMSPAQVRGARGMLDRCMLDLAAAAQVSFSTIKRIEDGAENMSSFRSLVRIQVALEAEGISFATVESRRRGLWIEERVPELPTL
jgi:hypothetical protein